MTDERDAIPDPSEEPHERFSLLEVIEAIGAELDELHARRNEIAELAAIAAPYIDPVLSMALQAQCAARGIDWQVLLTDAVRSALASTVH